MCPLATFGTCFFVRGRLALHAAHRWFTGRFPAISAFVSSKEGVLLGSRTSQKCSFHCPPMLRSEAPHPHRPLPPPPLLRRETLWQSFLHAADVPGVPGNLRSSPGGGSWRPPWQRAQPDVPSWPSQGSGRSVLPRQPIRVTTMSSVALAALLSYPSVQDIQLEMRNDNKVGHLLLCSSQLVHKHHSRQCTWPPYTKYQDRYCRLLEGLSVFNIFIEVGTFLAWKSLFGRTSRPAPFLSLNLCCLPGGQTSHPGFHHSEWAQLPRVSQENLAGENRCIFC